MSDQTKHYAFLMKKASQRISDLEAQIEREKKAQHEPIAIIGMGCRVPGANNPETFWQLLCDGVDAVTQVPEGRWDIDAYYDPNPETPGKMYTLAGGFIDHLQEFDPLFFSIAPREAVSLDPHYRPWGKRTHGHNLGDRRQSQRHRQYNLDNQPTNQPISTYPNRPTDRSAPPLPTYIAAYFKLDSLKQKRFQKRFLKRF